MLTVSGLFLNPLTSDPGTLADGMAWFRSDINELRARLDGNTVTIATLTDLAAFLPIDGTTAMTGALDAGGNKVTNVTNPTADGDAANQGWVVDKIKQYLQALDPQESVLDQDLATPPVSPTEGDRYIVATGGTGAWAGRDTEITQWDENLTAWVFSVPDAGTFVIVEDESLSYYFNGSIWTDFGVTLATAIAVSVGTVNAEGSGSTLARANHTHAVTDLAMASQVQGSVLYFNGTNWIALPPGTSGHFLRTNGADANPEFAAAGAGSALVQKAGVVLNGPFTGSPQKATVTFASPFADAAYSIALEVRTTNDQSFPISIESSTRLAASFVIVLDSNDKTDLVAVEWTATKHGES